MKNKKGFTLIELLIATLLVLLLFGIMYATFFSVSNTIEKVEKKMKISEIIFKFISRFKMEVKCMIREEKSEPSFDIKEITFLTITETSPYPVRVTYTVEKTPEGLENLLRKQESLLTNYSFLFSVIDGYDSIKFLFYIDGIWREYVDKPEKVSAIGLEIMEGNERLFFPVKMYGTFVDEEEK
ncbi:MAG: prepilin-type N-terminal cleavage/methylation domain-containing protein [bacterium]|nr:prepilin-type N-terminal cleavage/methylation domain-containing protein [bacterium]